MAHTLKELREGNIQYSDISKKELWGVLNTVLENPSLGITDQGSDQSLRNELIRIINIMSSIDGINYQSIIEKVCSNLTYDTLLVLHQMMHNHINMLAAAKYIAAQHPGELESIGQEIGRIGDELLKNSSGDKIDVNDEKIELSLLLAMQIFRLLNDLHAASIEILS